MKIRYLLVLLFVLRSIVFAADPYMRPYPDSLIFFVHGINSDRYTWYQAKVDSGIQQNGSQEQWVHYLMSLGIHDDKMFPYSFSKMSGWHARNMLELGGVGYKSEGGDLKAENNQNIVIMNDGTKVPKRTGIEIGTTRTWIEQAVEEYKLSLYNNKDINPQTNRIWGSVSDIPNLLLPSKLVMLAHSQGNFAVRGYIQSGALAREEDFFSGVPDSLLSPQSKAKIKENPLGFYQYPVSKVVFINPTLRGGEIHTYLMLRVVSNLKRLSELKIINGLNIGGRDVKVGQIIGDLGAIAVASDENALTELAASDIGDWAMTPLEIKGTPIGDVKKTNAEVFVVVTDLIFEQMTKTGKGPTGWPNIASWFQMPGQTGGGGLGITWGEFLAKLRILFPDIDPDQWTNYIAKGEIPPIKGVGNPFEGFAKSLEQDDIPGMSYFKGMAHLAKESRAKSVMMGGMIDTGFVNASEESVGNKQHVGPGGTEKMLLDKVLKEDIQKLPGNFESNLRKWQPKYRIISSEGSIATDPKLTRMAFAADAGTRVLGNLGINGSLEVPVLGFDMAKDPYMAMTVLNSDFWKLKRSQQFYAMAASQLGGVFTKAGDIVVSNESLRGDGVRELEANDIDIYRKENGASITGTLDDTLTTILAVDSLMLAIRFNPFCPVEIPGPMRGWIRAGVYLNYGARLGVDLTQGIGDLLNQKTDSDGVPRANPIFRDLAKHLMVMGYAKSEGHTPDMDKSLYEAPKVIMDGVYTELEGKIAEKRGITQASVTANYVAIIAEPGKPVTKFTALPESNWAGVKFTWPSYERVVGTVTPNEVIAKAIAGVSVNGESVVRKLFYERIPTFAIEGGGEQAILVRDSRYEYEQPISVMTTAGESVVLRGSLMDFTPRHPETVLEYSNNFSGWTPVQILNDYGHFELGPLKLYEGQNVIAFRAKNRAGYSSNQILKILKTGITLQPVLDELSHRVKTDDCAPETRLNDTASPSARSSVVCASCPPPTRTVLIGVKRWVA